MDSMVLDPESPSRELLVPPTMVNKDPSPPKKSNIRKRTKTGCLTCRKRRIKCDEGKPICQNCIKSKRACDGYNTRVVFKNPMGALPGGPFGPISYHHPDPTEALVNAQLSSTQAKASSSSQGLLPIIAPKPPSLDFGSPAHFQYLDAYPCIHRANGTTSLGLGIQHPQYIMGHIPSDPYIAQPSLGMTASPTQLNQQDLFDFHMPSQAPPELSNASFASPERRHTAFARIERPVVSPTLPYTPPTLPPQSAKFETSVKAEPGLSDQDDISLDDSEDEQASGSVATGFDANSIGHMVSSHLHAPFDLHGTQIRSFHTLADENALANYLPFPTDTPLNDHQTGEIFKFFVYATAPALSMYERNPLDPARIFSRETVPKSQQHIWTYIFPVQSFQHPALLQAILALGSLQMAELQGDTPTASWRHYGLCTRRSAKNYQSPTRRAQPATLAATLLLGFYEVWSSNHEKWCTHMIGARQIITETPFREMSRQVLAIYRQRQHQWMEMQTQADVDLDLVSRLTGKPVNFVDDPNSSSWESTPRHCTDRDLENYEQLTDLYWWFCKMDVYQSTLGASKLFMEYNLWTQCPPRAPINRINQIYGTFDHLILLLGRLSNFVADDLPRKRKAKDREASASPEGPNSPPMFPGMFPGRGNIKFPRGLSPPREASTSAEKIFDDIDLETSTLKALEEWKSILQAFELFKQSLGPGFDPLSADLHPPRDSPFGPALTYRTYSIAGIWMNFYMGLVILHRAHPNMPPFAMVAAHMVAKETDPYANEIGRIVAGIGEDWTMVTMVSTTIGAAYIECCFPLFVAAVQLRDNGQRRWAIRAFHAITRLTGWKTGDQIANGCEGAWRKAATMGVAPPYEPEPETEALRHGWTTRRIDERIQEIDEGQNRGVLQRSDRAHIAFGLLSIDADFDRLKLED